jgi:hypothetical protein
MYGITDDVVSDHALAARWNVRTQLLREIARAIIPGLDEKGQRERYYLGRDEQEAVRDIDRDRPEAWPPSLGRVERPSKATEES